MVCELYLNKAVSKSDHFLHFLYAFHCTSIILDIKQLTKLSMDYFDKNEN